jgi:hypothetical protein
MNESQDVSKNGHPAQKIRSAGTVSGDEWKRYTQFNGHTGVIN